MSSSRVRKASESPVENGIAVSPGVPCCLHAEPDPSKPGHALNGCLDPGDLMIDPDEPGDAVKLVCSNAHCSHSLWAHADCFGRWERVLLNASKLRAPGTMGKIRCPCGRGQVSRDTRQSPPQLIAAGVRKRQTNGLVAGGSSYSPTDMISRRFRHLSNSSNQSGNFSLSPPQTDGNAPGAPLPFSSPVYTAAAAASASGGGHSRGNIFQRRSDNYDSLKALPRWKQNKFHIVTEDDSSTENDELKSLVLTTLTACRCPTVACVLCSRQMPVYDHFPLVDGTFFLSPLRHNKDSPACGKGYLHAVCMHCACVSTLHSRCRFCQRVWDGSHLLIGGVYLFDVFACCPCCPDRLMCAHCRRPAVKDSAELPSAFSHFSQAAACAHCRAQDFHFVKPAGHIFRQVGAAAAATAAAMTGSGAAASF
ncbi:hypothetical protein BOX15_Mlig002818g1 [Macrostomum lignano]|uniref:Uncharacterized protein n=1 Tax=Macrostomum lignano TaxID=282301 RepID=A0A267GKK1_9PLAT|nr:hypothetical protein BOX15_Mlig002818g1 [Macrostomum lignano]